LKRRVASLLLALLLSASVIQAQDTGQAGHELFSGERALEHVAHHVAGGPIPTASENNLRAGDRILNYLSDLGWDTYEDWHLLDFGPEAELSAAARQTLENWAPIDVGPAINERLSALDSARVNFDSVVVPVRNLVATTGEGPTIIIGAHYDSRLYADNDPDPANHRQPVPGANDGGSGVGVLLELARVISEAYTPNVELRFVFFDAEDNGRIEPFTQLFGGYAGGYLIGSYLYATNLDLRNENIQYMLLVDLVGDHDQRFPIEGYSNQFAPELVRDIWQVAADLGYETYFPNEVRGAITDDHVPFLQRGIPAVDIIDLNYDYWHTTSDTIEQVSADSLERVGRVLVAYLERSGAITPVND